MTTISGFTFVYNAIAGGYPIIEAVLAIWDYVDEVVIVDCQSTDETPQILARLAQKMGHMEGEDKIRIIPGHWGNEAGKTLKNAHAMYRAHCKGKIILHFEADEVWGEDLISVAYDRIQSGFTDLAVYRLQLEQNFQRCRWYPETVHRVWPRDSYTIKLGHTTTRHHQAHVVSPECGYLWDITNCFRDNWYNRVKQQAELRQEDEPQYLLTPLHVLHKRLRKKGEVDLLLQEKHWVQRNTPFNIPEILRPLVGKTKYDPKL